MTQTHDETTPVGGRPDRRRFLVTGGLGVAAAALIAACGSDVDTSGDLPVSGTPPTQSTATPETIGPDFDITLLRTSQSIELAAIEGLKGLLASSFVEGPAVAPAFNRLIEHHQDHADFFGQQARQAGGTPYPKPNPYLMESVITTDLDALTSPDDVLVLAVLIENTLAQTYVFASEVLSTVALRQTVATVGFATARQISVVYLLQDQPAAPLPRIPRGGRVTEKSYLPESAA